MMKKYTGGDLSALCGERMDLLELMTTASSRSSIENLNLASLLAAYQAGDPDVVRIMNMDSQDAAKALRAYIRSRRSDSVN